MIDSRIIALRHELHRNPEISNREYETSKRIAGFISALSPDKVIDLGRTGKAFIFESNEPGKTLMFRAELDALPIAENTSLAYSSQNQNTAHACGHDGHMAIVAGLALKISQNRPAKGKVILLFQPAEEVEQGAKDVVENPEFQKLKPDYIFALHNIPGIKKNKILLRNGSFAAASKGMTIKLYGKTSHAAEPENGISPAMAVSLIIQEIHHLENNKILFNDMALLTIIHIKLGEISFGTSPGYAEIMITLRAFEDSDMKKITNKAESIINRITKEENLQTEISYSEIFPATVNDPGCIKLIKDSAIANNLEIEYLPKPFKWSEDFAYFTEKYTCGYFGLGSGINQPQLHNPDFDFPDEIIETGVNVMFGIFKKINF